MDFVPVITLVIGTVGVWLVVKRNIQQAPEGVRGEGGSNF